MVQVLTAVKDEAGNLFGDIWQTTTIAVAIRRFSGVVRETKFISENAKDFNLYFLGHWDTETGSLMPREKAEIVAAATEFAPEKEKKEKKENK